MKPRIVEAKNHSVVLSSHFHVGKKMFSEFIKLSEYTTVLTRVLIVPCVFLIAIFMPTNHAHLEICVENSSSATPT